MADPVAEKSSFLCMYMSSHPDTLVAYAKWYGKVQEPISSADMTGIDTKGMNLRCTLRSGQKKEVRVPIEPPLKGYDDVKPRLLEMKALAQEGLGMIKSPVLNELEIPAAAWAIVLLVAVLCYLTFFPRDSDHPAWIPAKLWHGIAGDSAKYALMFLAFCHFFEMMYTAYLCYSYKTGIVHGLIYVAMTATSGLYIWRDLRRRAQTARINSVMKIE
ncbi:hypothetical protein K435DRAFT_750719 [Dendrothele bispora CBS 962.96]|uniref:DUF2470 domain-containing protein n=1 Tax=Dendrothele bispora (strain CBS 962.96) TaxID=1314807 RepID=A0A4S8MDZ3_DENBC|nr:hypothetical protein K435DRAFT_750719 [Dendrothele bispora CBS 962.96]